MMQDQSLPESRNYIMPRHTEHSLSNSHQPLPRVYNTPPLPSSKMNRAVIPSKRAAQNRAAQKAFRQRREQYVKDLEKRSGEMEHWKEEMDQLRQENKRLRETVSNLERRLAEVAGESMPSPASNTQSTIMPGNSRTGQDSHDNELTQQSTEIIQDDSDNEECGEAPYSPGTQSKGSSIMPPANSLSYVTNHSEPKRPSGPGAGSFLPVPLRAPNQTIFMSLADKQAKDGCSIGKQAFDQDPVKKRRIEPLAHSPNTPPFSHSPIPLRSYPPNLSHPAYPPDSQKISATPGLESDTMRQGIGHPIALSHPQQMVQPGHEFWAFEPSQTLDFDFNFDPFFEDEVDPHSAGSHGDQPDFVAHANSGRVLDDLFAVLQTRQRPQIPIQPEETLSPSDYMPTSARTFIPSILGGSDIYEDSGKRPH
ncbi:hypothetical protein CLU79DRAFT_740390 [Phycomyces nitens]|nr:hypothetical protein CLU79DRAFT_740390 [Phycomyces nitens]